MSPSNTWCTATSLLGSFLPKVSIARVRAIRSTLGTDSKTCSPVISRRLSAALLTPRFTSSVSASCSSSFSVVGEALLMPRSPDLALGALDKSPERRLGERFGKEGGARCVRSVDDLLLVVCGNHRDGHRRAYAAKLRGEIQAISTWHVEVQHHEIRLLLLQRRERLVGVGRLDTGPVRTKPPQDFGNGHARQFAVVDHENFEDHETSTKGRAQKRKVQLGSCQRKHLLDVENEQHLTVAEHSRARDCRNSGQ